MGSLRVASFTVSATAEQSARWKRAAESAGHRAVGTWLAEAADLYMRVRARAGLPIALCWRRGGRFRVVLMDGQEIELRGTISPPFAYFLGDSAGPSYEGCKAYSLVYLPERRILATLRYAAKARALASEIAPALLRGLPPPDPGGITERYRREA